MSDDLRIVATADLGGLGAKEGPPLLYSLSAFPLSFSRAFAPRVVPWLVILGLLLRKPNRCGQAWWVGLPLVAVAGLALGVGKCPWPNGSEFRETVHPLLMALGFGWAGMLLLAPPAFWPVRLGRFGGLLLGLGLFSLLGLAFSRDGKQGTFVEIIVVIRAVLLQFTVFALAAALSLAGWSARQRFTLTGLLKWFLFWLIVVWLGLVVPCVALSALDTGEVLIAVLTLAGLCSLASLIVSVPFLALITTNPFYRERLQQLLKTPP